MAWITGLEEKFPSRYKVSHSIDSCGECPLCLARFQRPEHVKRHLKCHSSEKPYVCDMEDCVRCFNRRDNMKAHLKKIHGKVV